MEDMFAKEKNSHHLPQQGDMIEGHIIKLSNNEIILELDPLGTGIIYGGELKENREMIRDLKVGQKISALVIEAENDDGYVELSLKEANLEKSWTNLEEYKRNNKTVAIKVLEANRGGLVVNIFGLIGFLPVSQLSSEHYPRVENGDKNRILEELNKFIGKELSVNIISLDKKTEKIVVSEKAVQGRDTKEKMEKYNKGDIVEGAVSALTNFGAFIKLEDNIEGLIHISELDWQIINHPSQILKQNELVKAQIIDIREGQISLSLRSLKKDPWKDIEGKYKNGQVIKGTVIKFNPLGAFVQIEKGIHGLAHLSEFSKKNQQIQEALELGQSYNFEILSVAPDTHKMSLGLK